jgi:hypothetical protein
MRAACVAALVSTLLGLPAAAQEPPPRCRIQPDGDHVVVSSEADGFGIRLFGPAWRVACSDRHALLARSPILEVSVARRDGAGALTREADEPRPDAFRASRVLVRPDGVVLELEARWTGPLEGSSAPERALAIRDLVALQLDSVVLLDAETAAALASLPE